MNAAVGERYTAELVQLFEKQGEHESRRAAFITARHKVFRF